MTAIDAYPTDDLLDAELRKIVEAQRVRAQTRPSMESVTPREMRMRAAAEFVPWNDKPEPLPNVRDFTADGVPVRLYPSQHGSSGGLLVYLHGGGWVIGDLDLEDSALRRLANRSGVSILSVDYRLAPENPFPAALDDAERAIAWVHKEATALNVDSTRIGLGGASAGANIALGTALRLRGSGMTPVFLMLMYGAYAGGAETSSYLAFGDGRFGLPRAAMDWFWRTYLGDDFEHGHPHAVPLNADLADLPPVFLNYAELDILRDDSRILAERLREAEVAVEAHGYPGAIHGFTQYLKGSALARQALDTAGDALRTALA